MIEPGKGKEYVAYPFPSNKQQKVKASVPFGCDIIGVISEVPVRNTSRDMKNIIVERVLSEDEELLRIIKVGEIVACLTSTIEKME